MNWKQTSFWTKIMVTTQALATFTQLSLIFGNSQHIYNVIVTVFQLAGLILPIWMEDKDGDGYVDVFEKEVTVTMKSDAPITVKTETETKTE